MSPAIAAVIKAIILPPTINVLIVLLGLLLLGFSKRVGRWMQWFGLVSLLLLSLKPFSYLLISPLEHYPPVSVPVSVTDEQAIVVLSAGLHTDAAEFGRSIDGTTTLQRNLYGAYLYSQTGLPVLVSGGMVDSDRTSHAKEMARTLEELFHVQTVWQEARSLNTAQNAMYSAEILRDRQMNSIFLVTHASHMPRAVKMFETQGIDVTPAATAYTAAPDFLSLRTYLPSVSALADSQRALYEYLGLIWYGLRY